MPKRIIAKKSKKQKPLGGTAAPKKTITKQKSNSSTNPDRVIKGKKPHSYRDKPTIKRLNLYNEKPDSVQRHKRPELPAMIQPDRRWFGNTRTISQDELQVFRKEVKEAVHDSYSVLLNRTQLPISLINEPSSTHKPQILEIESFQSTFGEKALRKRPKLGKFTYEGLLSDITEKTDEYSMDLDPHIYREIEGKDAVRDKRLEAGQSKRIWEELYRVLDSSDIVCEVLDVRNPLGTRCPHIEKQIKKQPHKHLFFLLNKCDLVPTGVTVQWVKELSKEYPTIAFHASITNSFGKSTLISLLKQFDKLHRDKKSISVGFIGYPNVGKSSVINTLRSKVVCKVAPIPGETKVWQYITFTKRIYLIDCPGVVYNTGDTDSELVLKGVVRPEKIEDATLFIKPMLELTNKESLKGIYGLSDWEDAEDFLAQLAFSTGKLLKGAEPDLNTVAKKLLHDWQRGKIPYYFEPPAN